MSTSQPWAVFAGTKAPLNGTINQRAQRPPRRVHFQSPSASLSTGVGTGPTEATPLWSQGGEHTSKLYRAESQRTVLGQGCLKVQQPHER